MYERLPQGPLRLLSRAVRRRCPHCAGNPFASWFRLADNCARCGLKKDRSNGNWVGGVGINTIVTFATIAIALVVGILVTYPDLSAPTLLVFTLAPAVIMPTAFWPFSQTIWLAFDIMMQPVKDDELDPRLTGV